MTLAATFGALVAVGTTLCLAGCGSTDSGDAGGFTSADRNAAQSAVDGLKTTSATTMILQLSGTHGIPAICQMRRESTSDEAFKLFIAWIPQGLRAQQYTGDTYSWLQVLFRNGVVSNWRLASSAKRSSVAAAYGNALSQPFDRCQIMADGSVHVLKTSALPSRALLEGSGRAVAPAFTLPLLNGTGQISLESFRGKAVVLTFWSSYDGSASAASSVRALGVLEKSWERWRKQKNVVFIGVDESDLAVNARRLARKIGVSYPTVRDASGELLPRYSIQAFPATVFVGSSGKLEGGPVASDPSALARALNDRIPLAVKS
jgi:peroxiredoxin